jgi:hypothetical protein
MGFEKPNSIESDALEILSILIQNYEKSEFPIEPLIQLKLFYFDWIKWE